MVLLHELAHLRRWDNLVNLLQRFVESLLFFHPVVWWLSGWVGSSASCVAIGSWSNGWASRSRMRRCWWRCPDRAADGVRRCWRWLIARC